MKKLLGVQILIPVYFLFFLFTHTTVVAQTLQLPDGTTNYKCKTGRKIGVTQIEITWSAPGVKGREGKIWGTDIAPYGYTVLGFGSNIESPWRAGADECTNISFSTDVMINGKKLPAGKYAFFIALYPDSCTLIFNKNTKEWGSYFYKSNMDVLRVTTIQQKNNPESVERLAYFFSKQTDKSVEVNLQWEKWQIPFVVEVDLIGTTLSSIQSQMSGALGFDPPSLEAAANWCLQNNVNTDEALGWINSAVDPNLGGVKTFRTLSTKAGLLKKINKNDEADKSMKEALDVATATELHSYGRQLITENKPKEAMDIFQMNFKKFNGAWPTTAGMMRGYSAIGNYKKALEYANKALAQAPNDQIKKIISDAIDTLSKGKAL